MAARAARHIIKQASTVGLPGEDGGPAARHHRGSPASGGEGRLFFLSASKHVAAQRGIRWDGQPPV